MEGGMGPPLYISLAASLSGHRTSFDSMSACVNVAWSTFEATSLTLLTYAKTCKHQQADIWMQSSKSYCREATDVHHTESSHVQ